ncbi:MAG: hypothetical protein D6802_03240 [Ardenticatenia bacterium]|nr:MAG: hypothetical protein D6802_03240 [Ardenticatenia bacterium]
MQYQALLSRSWHIFKTNRTLWWLAFLLAFSGRSFGNFNFPDLSGQFDNASPWMESSQMPDLSLALIVGAVCITFLLVIVLAVVRYVARVGFIQTVVHAEQGEHLSFKEALRLGWSKDAWRLFLADFLLGLGVFGLVLLFVILPLCGLFVFADASLVAGIDAVGVIFIILFILFGILVLLIVSAFVTLLSNFASRAIVLEKWGAVEGLQVAWNLVLTNAKPSLVLFLIAFGIGLLSGIAQLVVMFVVGLPLFFGGMVAWQAVGSFALIVMLALVGILLLWLVSAILLAPFEGFLETYWTLAFQELRKPSTATPVA